MLFSKKDGKTGTASDAAPDGDRTGGAPALAPPRRGPGRPPRQPEPEPDDLDDDIGESLIADDQPQMDDQVRNDIFAKLDDLALNSILAMAEDADADPQVKLKAFNTAAAWVKSRGKVKPQSDSGTPVNIETMRRLMDDSHRRVMRQNKLKDRRAQATEKAVRRAAGEEVAMDGDASSAKLKALIDQLAQEN